MLMPLMRVTGAVMMPTTAQEPGTCDVYSQAETGNRDRLGKMDVTGAKRRLTDS